MTPEDRWYLMQFANCLASSERLYQGLPIANDQVAEKAMIEGEEAVYIQISHQLAMEAGLRLGRVAIDDRANEQEEESANDATTPAT